jgi:hypothetical protein
LVSQEAIVKALEVLIELLTSAVKEHILPLLFYTVTTLQELGETLVKVKSPFSSM